jgi:quinoprotein glucose dehydrogenase
MQSSRSTRASASSRWAPGAVFIVATGLACAQPPGPDAAGTSNASAGTTGHSPLAQITRANVSELINAWTFHTGDLERRDALTMHRSKFQVTPILAGDKLLVCTPFNEVIALDPGTGAQLWRYDSRLRTDYRPGNLFNCRGVAVWTDAQAHGGACAGRVFTATNDARLIALDLATGLPCQDFGDHGQVQIKAGIELLGRWEFQITSAPVVVRGRVIVGSSIADNQRVGSPRGTVRAFDPRTGALSWQWDPIPHEASDPASATWGDGWQTTGSANVWAPMSGDEARGLVLLPTSSPSPDFYGGLRPGSNLYADSVVALNAQTGERVWHFQTVHHDVWDYDVASAPALASIDVAGQPRAAVIQGTKAGLLFVLDRDSGRPLLPVEERPVPQGGVAGEALSATQPFPADLPPLGPIRLTPDDAWGVTPFEREDCRHRIEAARNEGIFTPPGERGTIIYPMNGGGVNWGGLAIDPAADVVFVNTNRLVHLVTLFPADRYDAMKARFPGKEVSRQAGAPFGMMREVLLSAWGLPCNRPPWGVLSAVDLRARRILWEVPLGTTEEIAPLGLALHTGSPNFGGPLHTAGGLIFIGAATDRYLRAFDAATGAERWLGRLPAAAMSTPASYEWHGRQYVVVAAGGHGEVGAKAGDAVVAFALPVGGQSAPDLWTRWIDRPGRRLTTWSALGLLALLMIAGASVRVWRRRRPSSRNQRSG